MDDAFGLQDPHGSSDLQQEHSNGVLAQGALGCNNTHKYKSIWHLVQNTTLIDLIGQFREIR